MPGTQKPTAVPVTPLENDKVATLHFYTFCNSTTAKFSIIFAKTEGHDHH